MPRRIAYGDLTVQGTGQGTIGSAEGRESRRIDYERQAWRPSLSLSPNLPGEFTISLACWTGPDGLRRWFPEDVLKQESTIDGFVGQCFLGGLEILRRRKGLTVDQVQSYRGMYSFFARRKTFREYYQRHFNWSRDLFIRPSGRLPIGGSNRTGTATDAAAVEAAADERRSRTVLSVVAPTLGVKQFFDQAQQASRARGIQKPTKAQLVAIGLHELARQNPLRLKPGEVPDVVRKALFDLTQPPAKVAKALNHPLVPRLLKAIESHRDDTDAEFDKWFCGRVSHSFRNLAEQKRAAGGPMSPEQAKQVVLALVWHAYQYVANCVHAQLRIIQQAVQPPMSRDEATLYERAYLKQKVFADLPWLLIKERRDVFAPELYPWLGDPRQKIDAPVLHRLLQMYASLVAERRAADQRATKQRRRRASGAPAEHTNAEWFDQSATADMEAVEARCDAPVIIKRLGLTCTSCGSRELEPSNVEEAGEMVHLELRCEACGKLSPYQRPLAELRAMARRVSGGG